MKSRWDCMVAFAKHGLDTDFNDRGDGLHSTRDGYTLSLQWGFANYCEDRWKGNCDTKHPWKPNFEVAVWDPQGDLLPLQDYDQVVGWVSWDKLDTLLEAFKAKDWQNLAKKIL